MFHLLWINLDIFFLRHTEKSKHYAIFKQTILKNPLDISLNQFLSIVENAYDVNKQGKRRKITKDLYLKKYKQDIASLRLYKNF